MKNGDIVWDSKFKEKFEFDENRDRMIIDRLEPYNNQDVGDKVCETCGGTGEVTTMERVYPNEPHMAPIGTAPCPDCSSRGDDDYDNQE